MWSVSHAGYCEGGAGDRDPNADPDVRDADACFGSDPKTGENRLTSICKQKCLEDSSCGGISVYGPASTGGNPFCSCFFAKPACTPVTPPGSKDDANWGSWMFQHGAPDYYTFGDGATT